MADPYSASLPNSYGDDTKLNPIAPKTFQGVDPTSTRTGTQARQSLEGLIGRSLTPDEMSWTGYTDPTGNTAVSGETFNTWLQEAARRTGGGVYTPWQAPTTTTPTTPNAPPGGPAGLPNTPAPGFTPPTLTLPTYQQPGAFDYGTFKPPTLEDLYGDAGVQARLQRGSDVIQNSAAAKGVLHTPNTIQGLIDYNQEAIAGEYSNAYNRALGTHQAGYGQAADIYDRNLGVGTGAYDRNYQRAGDLYGAEMTGAQLGYAPDLLTWQQGNRINELMFDRDWQRTLYDRDDSYRRDTYNQDRYDRRDFYDRDDAFRRFMADEERRRFLASLGKE